MRRLTGNLLLAATLLGAAGMARGILSKTPMPGPPMLQLSNSRLRSSPNLNPWT